MTNSAPAMQIPLEQRTVLPSWGNICMIKKEKMSPMCFTEDVSTVAVSEVRRRWNENLLFHSFSFHSFHL